MIWKREKVIIAMCVGVALLMPIDRGEAGTDGASKLLELAREKFGTLTEAEEKLFRAVAIEQVADYSAEAKENNDPSMAEKWGDERVLKADRIWWLCTNGRGSGLVGARGILVKGARIEGKLDLLFGKVLFPLYFEKCAFPEGIDLRKAEVRALYFGGTHVGVIEADGLKVESDVFLDNGFKSQGGVLLMGATIGGNLQCDGSRFINADGVAINADRLIVKGSVLLGNGFESEGEVRLVNARINGVVACYDGHFINKGAKAINADSLEVGSNVLMRQGFEAKGEVSLIGAKIGGNLDCYDGQFMNRDATALSADGVKVEGGVFLRNGFKSEGEVRLVGATIGGDLDCSNGQLKNGGALALSASGVKVEGRVFLRDGFKAEGEVRLVNGSISGVLDCGNGQFINRGANALRANGLKVRDDILLNNSFRTDGLVSMRGVIVDGSFVWTGIASPTDVTLDLRFAEIGTLWDDQKSWPKSGKLFLDGFSYENIGDDAPKDAKSRIEWLNRQGEEQFRPGPYEQLAKVLNKMGHGEDAKKILIEKEKKITRLSGFGWRRFWRGVLGVTIGYGYRPWRALWFIGAFILIGLIVFGSGRKADVIVPVEKEAYVSGQGGQLREGYPKFNALVYSIEMFVPVVDLRMAKYWMPDANKAGMLSFKKWSFRVRGDFVRWYMWGHICAGWILTTLLIVGLTGLVKK